MDNSKNKYSRKSFFKAGQIVQHIIEHKEERVINYSLSYDNNIYEVVDILKQHTNREIVLTPILYGFNICLTDKTDV